MQYCNDKQWHTRTQMEEKVKEKHITSSSVLRSASTSTVSLHKQNIDTINKKNPIYI